MIAKMKRLHLVCLAAERDAALERLRALGAVHLDLGSAQGEGVARARGRAADAAKALRAVAKARTAHPEAAAGTSRLADVDEILAAQAEVEAMRASASALSRQIARYEPYGDFDPALAGRLLAQGIDLSSVADLPEKLPPKRLSEMKRDLEALLAGAAEREAGIAGADAAAIEARFPALREALDFEAARELVAVRGEVAGISGWIPAAQAPRLAREAENAAWGTLLRDPEPGETPPTLVEPPRLFRPMKALFAGLGIAPAYVESDVSVPFMCYFALFFAMLVGDGAYGAIFLGATLAFRRRLSRSWFALMATFSCATVAWGLLSNTWFGAALPCCADWPTVRWLSDPSYGNMMLLCFTIGVSHLALARVWNGVCRLPDSTAVAEFGWAGVLVFMYLVTNSIVGIFPGIPAWGFWVFGISLGCVLFFTVKPSELKTRGAELGMLPLNVMGALGDIISYVRLFAVGLASVKVAENFNGMALGLAGGAEAAWAKPLAAVAAAAVLAVGHGLNLAMAGLSVLVHAVRLNTLEFSNHKGVSWSGYAFRPFAEAEGKKS